MRTFGIVLVVIGILMIIFTQVNFTTEENVVDAGPIEINKEEQHSVGWPVYAGVGVAVIGGIMAIGAARKRTA